MRFPSRALRVNKRFVGRIIGEGGGGRAQAISRRASARALITGVLAPCITEIGRSNLAIPRVASTDNELIVSISRRHLHKCCSTDNLRVFI